MLSKALQAEFHDFGAVVLRAALSPDTVAAMWDETGAVLEEFYAHAPFDGSRRHWLPMLRADAPLTAGLAEDPRFLGAAGELFGDVVLLNVDTNRRVGDTYWHRDSDRVPGVRFALFQHPVTAGSGGLRVIPGSHRDTESARYSAFFKTHKPSAETVPAFAPSLEVGDVLMFDTRIWHASHGSSADRRMWTVTYFQAPTSQDATDSLRTLVHHLLGYSAGPSKFLGKEASVIDEVWAAEAQPGSVRAHLIDAMRRHGVYPTPGRV